MITLYYGNGICGIEGSNDVKGIQIFYEGQVEIEDNSVDGYELVANDKQIIIFPVNPQLSLNDLFYYTGFFKIKNVVVSNADAIAIPVSIKKMLNTSELLMTNAEDMTTNSEDLKANFTHKRKIYKTLVKNKIIKNLHTSNLGSSLYYQNGSEYTGYYHIHKDNQNCMTGIEHDKNSKDLYFYQGKKLLPTKNTTSIPYVIKNKKTTSRKRITTRTESKSSNRGGY
tara:strand:- start:1432 stop:2109 length:678 start_codon:yes stop_codon:yes gene_type:complete